MDIGAQLRSSREAQGMTLARLAERTRVQARILTAIELNDLSSIPPKPFGRGFVRAYAKEVGLDPEQTVRDYFGRFAPSEPVAPPAPTHGNGRSPQALGLMSALAAAGLVLAALWLIPNDPSATTSGPAQPAAIGTSGAAGDGPTVGGAQPAAAATTSAEPPAPAAPSPMKLEVTAARPSWLAAYADGRRVEYRLVPEGSQLTFRGDREITLRVGDAGALRLIVNGRDAGLLGRPGEVRTVRITPESAATFGTGSSR
jgi:hypothetical protein